MKLRRREVKALRHLFDALEPLARQSAATEVCGLIEWDGREFTLHPCENLSYEPETSFLIAARDQQRVLALVTSHRTELWGMFHSHPHEGAQPSERDRAFAADLPGLRWLIAGLAPEDGTEVEFWVGYP